MMLTADALADAVLADLGIGGGKPHNPLASISTDTLLREPHPGQIRFIESQSKRKVLKIGRRGGKTTGLAIIAGRAFLARRRVLYATPTQEQIDRFWTEIKRAFYKPIDDGRLYKNETLHLIELPNTETRIRAKTAWNADTLRGDYADLLILDEWQLMDETAWGEVGAPMLIDNDGDAIFAFTPPSARSRSASKARDPRHATKMYKAAEKDDSGDWENFHFTSLDNPHLSQSGLARMTHDMTSQAYRQEILAEDSDEVAGALWKQVQLDADRVIAAPDLVRIVVAIDPATTANSSSDETGIIVAGVARDQVGYVLEDVTVKGSPADWAKAAIAAYHRWEADRIVAETNNGGDMVENTIRTVRDQDDKPIGKSVPFSQVRASRGKATRAEPVAAFYEQHRVHHVGEASRFTDLEEQLCMWVPGAGDSPDRLDALVWALTELMVDNSPPEWDSEIA